jgi:hypothetical protein
LLLLGFGFCTTTIPSLYTLLTQDDFALLGAKSGEIDDRDDRILIGFYGKVSAKLVSLIFDIKL